MHIFTAIKDLEETCDEIKNLSQDEKQGLNNYFLEGGIIKANTKIKLKVFYPSKDIIKKELNKLYSERAKTIDKIDQWYKIKKNSENFIKKNKVKKFMKSTFWKHTLKSIFDKKYKEDFKKIKIPIEYIGEESIRKLVDEFINNLEYRQKLIETIDYSIVYKNKGIGDKVIKKLELQKEISKAKLDSLNTRKNKLQEKIKTYKLIQKWVVC